MKTYTLKFQIGGKEYKLGEIEFDRMGIDYEIKFSNRVYIEDVDVMQRGFYAYDAGEFCLTFDIIDNESGEIGNYYFDTEFINRETDTYILTKFEMRAFNPLLAAMKK